MMDTVPAGKDYTVPQFWSYSDVEVLASLGKTVHGFCFGGKLIWNGKAK